MFRSDGRPRERQVSRVAGLLAVSMMGFLIAGAFHSVSEGGWSATEVIRALIDPRTLHAVAVTLLGTGLAVLLSWIFSWPFALWFRRKNAFLLQFGVILPGMVHALAVLWVLRSVGVQELYSLRSVILAWTLAGVFFMGSGLAGRLADLNPREKEALRALGASPLRAFFLHELRRSWPAQRELLLQQVWLCFTSFSLVLILNGGPPNENLEVALYSALRLGGGAPERAAALGLWQSGLLLVLRWALLRWEPAGGMISAGEWDLPEGGRRFAFTFMGILAAVAAWVLAVGILRGGQAGMTGGLGDFLRPWGISLLLGLSVVVACAAFSLSCYLGGFRSLAQAASWTSPMILSYWVWRAWGRDVEPFFSIVLLQAALFAPGFSRGLFPVLDQKRVRELEAVRTLGASSWSAWWQVEWPRVRRVFLRASALTFSFSIMEVATVMLLSRGRLETLSSHTQDLFLRFRMEEAILGTGLLVLTGAGALMAAEAAR